MKLKVVMLGLLLLNLVSCASAPTFSFKKDPTKSVYVTEAFVYPEFRNGVVRESAKAKDKAPVVASVSSRSRGPASER